MSRWERWLGHWSLDRRSLGLFRIALGAVVLGDLLMRSQSGFFAVFHTDLGVLPRVLALETSGETPWNFSVHLASGSLWGMRAIFAIHAAFGLALLLGYRSRLASLVCWFFAMSLLSRTRILTQGGDIYLRILLLIGAFLPLGDRFSVERLLRPDPGPGDEARPAPEMERLESGAAFWLTIQIALVYLFAGIEKLLQPSWRAGQGADYAFHLEQFLTPVGALLSRAQSLMAPLNWLTIGLELGIGALLLIPPQASLRARKIGVLLIVWLHLGIALTINVGIFSWIALTAALALLPSDAWSGVRPGRGPSEFTIHYDGECGVCRRMVVILSRLLGFPLSRARKAQLDPRIEAVMERENSWVLELPGGALHTHFDGLLVLLRESGRAWARLVAGALGLAPLRALGNLGYRTFASHRPTLGRLVPALREAPAPEGASAQSETPRPGRIDRWLCPALAVVCLIYNLQFVPGLQRLQAIQRQPWVFWLGIDQKWEMFARPMIDDGWYTIPGTLANGARVELFDMDDSGRALGEPPRLASQAYPGDRWRKYMVNLLGDGRERYLLHLGSYLCRSWNASHPPAQRLEMLEILYMRTDLRPGGERLAPRPTLRWRHQCFEGMIEKWAKNGAKP